MIKTFKYNLPFRLESGASLPELNISYHTFGTLNDTQSNVVWVCHALTGNSNPSEWWPSLVGDGLAINPQEHFIICANVLSSCYGTTGPLSINPITGQPYYHLFPEVTIADMVRAHQLLANYIGITSIALLVGGSLGGQQAVEWAIQEPNRIQKLLLMASNAKHSPWGIAFNEAQRLAIVADRTYYNASAKGGAKGMRAARAIAMLSYRTYVGYETTQAENNDEQIGNFKAASYQRYQGDKLVKRFNAFTYVRLSQAMDSHNVGRGRGGVKKALSTIRAETAIVAVDSDILFPPSEQQFLAKYISGAKYVEVSSLYGHDGFLLEIDQITSALSDFLALNYQKVSV